jgi:hypothetical protein
MSKIHWKQKRPKIPIELINITWEYNGRYKKIFKNCVQELTRYFNHSRMIDRLLGEVHVYGVYLQVRNTNSYNRFDNKRLVVFSKYILSRISHYHGDRVPNDNLCPYRLKKICNKKLHNV